MSMFFKRIKNWAVSITAFRTGDVIPVDGPSGTAKMPYSDLAKEVIKDSANNTAATEADLVSGSKMPIMTANGPKALPGNAIAKASEQSALTTYAQNVAHSIAPEFDPTKPDDEGGYAYYAGTPVMYNGSCYVFTSNKKSGAWDFGVVEKKPLSEAIQLEGVGEAVDDWLNEHPEATTTVEDSSLTEAKFSDALKLKAIKEYVTPEMFGAVGNGYTNDTEAFVECIAEAVSTGKAIFLDSKVYAINTLDLTGTKGGVTIQGSGRYPTKGTQLKIIGDPDNLGVALKRFDPGDTTPSYQKRYFSLRDVFLNCNSKVAVGINGAYGTFIDNVWVRKATDTGIILENYTYPCRITNTVCDQNGKYGLLARGEFTTSYMLDHCEFNTNGEVGLYIQAAASVQCNNIIAQSNGICGVKLEKKNASRWLEHVTFINLYTENNGNNNDNHVEVTAETLDTNPSHKPAFIEFVNCQINGSFHVEACYSLKFSGQVHGTLETAHEASVIDAMFDFGATASRPSNHASISSKFIVKYLNHVFFSKEFIEGGVFSNRGNIYKEDFFMQRLTNPSGALMDNALSFAVSTALKGFVIPSTGSIAKIIFSTSHVQSIHGSITCTPMIHAGNYVSTPSNPIPNASFEIPYANAAAGNVWAANTAYTVGERVSVDNRRIYECVTAGTSGASFPGGTGTAIQDGTVVWKFLHDGVIEKTFEVGFISYTAGNQIGIKLIPSDDYNDNGLNSNILVSVLFEGGYK